MNKLASVYSLLMISLIPACTWVPLETHAAVVEVAAIDQDLSNCKKLAETTVGVRDHVWLYQRDREKVQQELENLARTSASERNGDTVQAISQPSEGEQQFSIYKCLD